MARTSATKKSSSKSTTKSNTKTKSRSTAKRSTAAANRRQPQNDNAQQQSDNALRKFFVDGIKDIYWAEKYLLKALTKMERAATTEQLGEAFATHREQTETHVERLEQVFEILGETARAKKCPAMEGLVEEGQEVIAETDEGTATRDVGLIISAQKVEHYEIAAYGGLAQLARTMGEDEIAEILTQTLEEEKETDLLLTEIAENDINYQAEQESEEDEE